MIHMNMNVLKFRLTCYSTMLQYTISNINSELMTSGDGYCAVPLKIPQTILEQYYIKVIMHLYSASIDELGNWCPQRLMGFPRKNKAEQGGSMATL